MARLFEALRNRRFQAFLFLGFTVLFGWPVLTIADRPGRGFLMFLYLFVCWTALIAVLLAIGIATVKSSSDT